MQIRHDLFGIKTGYLEPTFIDASNNYLVHHEPANAVQMPRDIFYSLMKISISFNVPNSIHDDMKQQVNHVCHTAAKILGEQFNANKNISGFYKYFCFNYMKLLKLLAPILSLRVLAKYAIQHLILTLVLL